MNDEPSTLSLTKIVSGGQTGVDRGALDAAMSMGIKHGGWCPRGRLAEDGLIPSKYQLREHSSPEYWVRTEQNVVDSDGTLILYCGQLSGGTELTSRMASKHQRPCHLVNLLDKGDPIDVRRWLVSGNIKVLNVAGPRESSEPGIREQSREFVQAVLS